MVRNILKLGLLSVNLGANPVYIKKGIYKPEELEKKSRPAKGSGHIKAVAAISAGKYPASASLLLPDCRISDPNFHGPTGKKHSTAGRTARSPFRRPEARTPPAVDRTQHSPFHCSMCLRRDPGAIRRTMPERHDHVDPYKVRKVRLFQS